MNTDIALLAARDGSDFEHAAERVREIFEEVEACLSRFRPESELSALNRSGGAPFVASRLLFQGVSLALQAAQATEGLFDPTVLPALESAGYDRSFEQLSRGTAGSVDVLTRIVPADFRAIHLDPATSTIRIEGGHRIDLGGIGKGLAVDRALEATAFLGDRCINAGGDIAARGGATGQAGWSIGLDDAGMAAPLTVLLQNAAMATSTVTKRRWAARGRQAHHLIDPRTGQPSTSALRTVTVVAGSCVQADVAAKTALLLGDRGMDFLERHGLHGFAVRHDGTTLSTARWPAP